MSGIYSREQIAKQAQEAFKVFGPYASNPYTAGTPAHDEWQLSLQRAIESDELEGSAT